MLNELFHYAQFRMNHVILLAVFCFNPSQYGLYFLLFNEYWQYFVTILLTNTRLHALFICAI